jgi:hypothetical protein
MLGWEKSEMPSFDPSVLKLNRTRLKKCSPPSLVCMRLLIVAKEGGKHFFSPEPELDADQVIYGKRS